MIWNLTEAEWHQEVLRALNEATQNLRAKGLEIGPGKAFFHIGKDGRLIAEIIPMEPNAGEMEPDGTGG